MLTSTEIQIYKEYLPIQPNVPIYTNIQGTLLTVEEQQEHLVVYFDTTYFYHKYNIYLVETGKIVNINNAKYLKTLMLFNGDYVLHVYVEEIE